MILTLIVLLALIFAPPVRAQVLVSWSWISEIVEDHFELERSPRSNSVCGEFAVIGVFPADVMSTEDIDIGEGCYRVRAAGEGNYFPYSNVGILEPLPLPQDTTKPTVTIVNPADGAIVERKSTVTVRSSFSDDVGVVRVRYLIDGSALNCPILATSCNWNVGNPPNKAYSIRVEANDQAGNVGAAQINVRSAR